MPGFALFAHPIDFFLVVFLKDTQVGPQFVEKERNLPHFLLRLFILFALIGLFLLIWEQLREGTEGGWVVVMFLGLAGVVVEVVAGLVLNVDSRFPHFFAELPLLEWVSGFALEKVRQ